MADGMPIGERLRLTVGLFAACAGLFSGPLLVTAGLEWLGFSEGAAAMTAVAALFAGLCFASTFVSGAPRWFRKRAA